MFMWQRTKIWFFCPACDEKLVIDRASAGQRVDCPECAKRIPVPTRSNALPNGLVKAGVYGSQILILLALAGFVWWQINADDEMQMASTVSSTLVASEAKPLAVAVNEGEAAPRDVNQQLLNDHAKLQDRYNSMLTWMMDNYRGKFPLPERLVKRLQIVPLDDKGEISADLAEVLKLSDDEKTQMMDVIKYVRANLEYTERERARITEQTDSRVT